MPVAVDMVIRAWYFGLGSLGRGFESRMQYLDVYVSSLQFVTLLVASPTCGSAVIGLHPCRQKRPGWISLEKWIHKVKVRLLTTDDDVTHSFGFLSCFVVYFTTLFQ
jgi:hypothetical protein